LEDVEKDLSEMNAKRRQQKAVEREEWASVIKLTSLNTDAIQSRSR
jgi:hypothetical protein